MGKTNGNTVDLEDVEIDDAASTDTPQFDGIYRVEIDVGDDSAVQKIFRMANSGWLGYHQDHKKLLKEKRKEANEKNDMTILEQAKNRMKREITRAKQACDCILVSTKRPDQSEQGCRAMERLGAIYFMSACVVPMGRLGLIGRAITDNREHRINGRTEVTSAVYQAPRGHHYTIIELDQALIPGLRHNILPALHGAPVVEASSWYKNKKGEQMKLNQRGKNQNFDNLCLSACVAQSRVFTDKLGEIASQLNIQYIQMNRNSVTKDNTEGRYIVRQKMVVDSSKERGLFNVNILESLPGFTFPGQMEPTPPNAYSYMVTGDARFIRQPRMQQPPPAQVSYAQTYGMPEPMPPQAPMPQAHPAPQPREIMYAPAPGQIQRSPRGRGRGRGGAMGRGGGHHHHREPAGHVAGGQVPGWSGPNQPPPPMHFDQSRGQQPPKHEYQAPLLPQPQAPTEVHQAPSEDSMGAVQAQIHAMQQQLLELTKQASTASQSSKRGQGQHYQSPPQKRERFNAQAHDINAQYGQQNPTWRDHMH